MTSFLEQIDQTPIDQRWARIRPLIFSSPLPFFEELRKHRPVLELPNLTIITRHTDCLKVLLAHDQFSVAPYVDKQGTYWMAQDDTAQHWREKSIMRSILDFEDIPLIRQFAADKSEEILNCAGGTVDAVGQLTRSVPTAMVQEKFGFDGSDAGKLIEWSYWNQMDAFWNQPFDAPFVEADAIEQNRKRSNEEMREYLTALVQRKVAEIQSGKKSDDPVIRLILLHTSGALDFPIDRLVLNVGGLLIGAVETISHATVNSILQLFSDPNRLESARRAAHDPDPSVLAGFVFEALRFQPAFPYFFRRCETACPIAIGTDYETTIEAGTMVLAMTHSAMFDENAVTQPVQFNPGRTLRSTFHFGMGHHECLGRKIGEAVVPEIVRQALLLSQLRFGEVDRKGGPVPEEWEWNWTTGT